MPGTVFNAVLIVERPGIDVELTGENVRAYLCAELLCKLAGAALPFRQLSAHKLPDLLHQGIDLAFPKLTFHVIQVQQSFSSFRRRYNL